MSEIPQYAMECETIDQELDRGSHVPSAAAVEHIRTCTRCRGLYHWMLGAPQVPAAGAGVNRRVRSRIMGSLQAVHPRASSFAQALRFFIVFTAAAMMATFMIGFSNFDNAGAMAMGCLLAVGTAVLSFSLAWLTSPASLHRYSVYSAAWVIAILFVVAAACLFPWHATPDFLSQGRECLGAGMMMALPAGALLGLFAARGYLPVTGALGTVLGALGGLFGASVLQFTCRRQEAAHISGWHGAVIVVSIVTGALAARLFQRFRSDRR